MKIVFVGTVEFSKKALEKLISLKSNIIAVLTKKNPGFNADFADLSEICKRIGIDYKFVKDINSKRSLGYIKNKNPDLVLCFGWSQLLGKDLLNIPKLGVIGFHPAMLPKNRGRHPLVWALALGLRDTASTFFLMDKGIDSGDIISQRIVKIDYRDDASSLYNKIIAIALKQIEEFIPLLQNNSLEIIKQHNSKANYWRKREDIDGQIDWRMSSESIYNLVRALTKPYIGAHFIYKNQKIRIWKVIEVKSNLCKNYEPGKIVKVYSNNSFLVKTGQNFIKVLECDLKQKVKVGEYI